MTGLKDEQYNDSHKFKARIDLHRRFGTNPYPWPLWVFDRFRKEDGLKVLELGCGTGMLWKVNKARIPGRWEIILSDFSEGMLRDAEGNVGEAAAAIRYEVVDIENIPYGNHQFDMIIANHMLYHVPDRKKAFAEIKRVLKPEGTFCATTMSRMYMKEIKVIIRDYLFLKHGVSRNQEEDLNTVIGNFCLENGEDQMREFFGTIQRELYENTLMVREAEPLVEYLYSCAGISRESARINRIDKTSLMEYVNCTLCEKGTIPIPADFILYTARNRNQREGTGTGRGEEP